MKIFKFCLILSTFCSSFLAAAPLIITCPQKEIPFRVELAQTPEELAKGLMFRTSLGEDEGMLFLYTSPHPVGMWMKNTPLSLDMLFFSPTGKILAIYKNASPYSLQVIGPVVGTSKVLEVLGGTVEKQGITKACFLKLDR